MIKATLTIGGVQFEFTEDSYPKLHEQIAEAQEIEAAREGHDCRFIVRQIPATHGSGTVPKYGFRRNSDGATLDLGHGKNKPLEIYAYNPHSRNYKGFYVYSNETYRSDAPAVAKQQPQQQVRARQVSPQDAFYGGAAGDYLKECIALARELRKTKKQIRTLTHNISSGQKTEINTLDEHQLERMLNQLRREKIHADKAAKLNAEVDQAWHGTSI